MELREPTMAETEASARLRSVGEGDHRGDQQNDQELGDLAHGSNKAPPA
jgi:hypothetical protein